MLFSERYGYKPQKPAFQRESMDEPLKTGLWNAINLHYWRAYKTSLPENFTEGSNLQHLVCNIWHSFFKRPIDSIPMKINQAAQEIRTAYNAYDWMTTLDFIQFCSENGPMAMQDKFEAFCNDVFERENSAYRFKDHSIVEITSETEISAAETALQQTSDSKEANSHFKNALNCIADRETPDYRKSIQESISAVACMCKSLTGDDNAKVRDLLEVVEAKLGVPPMMLKGWSALYEYVQDADSLHHVLMDKENVTYEDAKYMAVVCSAFISYLIGNRESFG